MTANFVFPFGLGFHLSFPCVAEENPLNDDVPDKQRPPSVPPVQYGGRSLFINTLLNTACLFFFSSSALEDPSGHQYSLGS